MVYAGAPLPGFEEEALTVPSSINTADADAACLNIGYVVSDYDCTDVPTTNPEIKVSLLIQRHSCALVAAVEGHCKTLVLASGNEILSGTVQPCHA